MSASGRHGEELARYCSAADVFVFPSLTDTFGLVMIEALACGVPVAAFPVTGSRDVIGNSGAGALDTNLLVAAQKALSIPSEKCVDFAGRFSWDQATRSFLSNLKQI